MYMVRNGQHNHHVLHLSSGNYMYLNHRAKAPLNLAEDVWPLVVTTCAPYQSLVTLTRQLQQQNIDEKHIGNISVFE